MAENGDDSRRYRRKKLNGKVVYKYADLLNPQVTPAEMKKSFEARSADISVSGMQLIVDTNLKIDSVIKMDIFLPEEPTPITTFGRVEWCRKHEEIFDIFTVGINFLVIDADYTQQIKTLVDSELI